MTGETIGFLGLGALGAPVATNLLEAGYSLRVWNRTPGKADALAEKGAVVVDRPADVAAPGGIVLSLLWDDASASEVIESDGFLERLDGGVHVSMTTVTPEGSAGFAARHAAAGSTLVEAPIFGRPEAAQARGLWIPYAGPEAARTRVRPVLETCGAKGVFDFGDTVGAATAVKLAGNFMIINMASAMGEAMGLVRAHGFDPIPVIDMLTSTLFDAPIFHGYRAAFASGRAPPSAIPAKDLGLFRASAKAVSAPAPICQTLLSMRGLA